MCVELRLKGCWMNKGRSLKKVPYINFHIIWFKAKRGYDTAWRQQRNCLRRLKLLLNKIALQVIFILANCINAIENTQKAIVRAKGEGDDHWKGRRGGGGGGGRRFQHRCSKKSNGCWSKCWSYFLGSLPLHAVSCRSHRLCVNSVCLISLDPCITFSVFLGPEPKPEFKGDERTFRLWLDTNQYQQDMAETVHGSEVKFPLRVFTCVFQRHFEELQIGGRHFSIAWFFELFFVGCLWDI